MLSLKGLFQELFLQHSHYSWGFMLELTYKEIKSSVLTI
jgi:hypothetical protein